MGVEILYTERLKKYDKTREYLFFKCLECKEAICSATKSELSRGKKKGYCKHCSSRVAAIKNTLEPFKTKYNRLVYNAKRRNIDCSITYEEYLSFCNTTCHYCENIIEWHPHKQPDKTNLDRKNNNLGYHLDNCVPCCWECNDLKSDKFSYDEFLLLTSGLKSIRIMRTSEKK